MSKIQNLIEAKGYELSQFDDELIEGYERLLKVGIELPSNVINPEICKGFFGVYSELIAEGDENLLVTLPYLRPGITFRHCRLITNAIKTNNLQLLNEYDKIFSNPNLSENKKHYLGQLASLGADYSELLPKSEEVIRQAKIALEAKRDRSKLKAKDLPLYNPTCH